MLLNRVIPVLLLQDKGLVKTIKFNNPKYVGDPINAVKIFNEKEVDELIFLDINATKDKKKPSFELLEKITSECFMPICYGGGINNIQDIKTIISLGVEKVCVNSFASENPYFIKDASDKFGSSTIVASIDVKKNIWGKYEVYINGGTKNTKKDPLELAVNYEKMGAGEILINSIDRDGTQKGYDINLIKSISSNVNLPVIACGGAGSFNDIKKVINEGNVSAAAGSLFVFQGEHRAVLINYLSAEQISEIN